MPHDPARVASILLASSALFVAPAALADGFDKSPDDIIAAKEQADKEQEQGDRMPGEKDKKKKPAAEAPSDPTTWDPSEDPHKAYYFVGLRFRDVILPKFMIDVFGAGGATVNVPSVGAELSYRKNGIEIDSTLSYADYSNGDQGFLFRGKNDGDEAYERVKSSLKVLYLTVDLLKDIPLDDKGRFSVLIGGGLGFGFVFGDLYRNQVYPRDYAPGAGTAANPSNPTEWSDCPDANALGASQFPIAGTSPPRFWCDRSNNHYGTYSEASWAHGGSKPIIFPWVSIPQISFRYKPMKQLQFRFDTGWSLTGFFFGLSGGYGLQ
jgi:hypothetical protein